MKFFKKLFKPGGVKATLSCINRLEPLDFLLYFIGGHDRRSGNLIAIIFKIILAGKIVGSIFVKVFNSVGLVIPNNAYRTSLIINLALSNYKIATSGMKIAEIPNFSTQNHTTRFNVGNIGLRLIVFVGAWKIVKQVLNGAEASFLECFGSFRTNSFYFLQTC